jgi:EmrB/QacA subfamily drug resistance transporter
VTSVPSQTTQTLTPRQIWIVLGSLMLGTALSALDTTIVSTALPTITGKLGGFESYAWVGTSYILVSTIATPILGKLGDLFGRRKMILIVIGIFTLGSLLCGISTNMTQLILARGVQGLGGGGIQALTFAILGELVSPRERGRYMGLYTGIYAASAVVGPLVGGWMIERFAWQWIFLINLPVAAIAIVAIVKTLHLPFVKRPAKLDLMGALLLSISLGALVISLEEGRDGWSRPLVVGLLAVALVTFGLFLRNEGRVPEPIVPLQLFRNRVFATGCAMGFVAGAMSFGVQNFLPLQFQDANFVKPPWPVCILLR